MTTAAISSTKTARPALRAYRVHCAGLQYIALATGAAQAIANAIALHGAPGASAQPLKGGAA